MGEEPNLRRGRVVPVPGISPTAIAGLVIIVVLILFALVGPMFTSYSYSAQNLDVVNIPPRMKVFETPDGDGYLYITRA